MPLADGASGKPAARDFDDLTGGVPCWSSDVCDVQRGLDGSIRGVSLGAGPGRQQKYGQV